MLAGCCFVVDTGGVVLREVKESFCVAVASLAAYVEIVALLSLEEMDDAELATYTCEGSIMPCFLNRLLYMDLKWLCCWLDATLFSVLLDVAVVETTDTASCLRLLRLLDGALDTLVCVVPVECELNVLIVDMAGERSGKGGGGAFLIPLLLALFPAECIDIIWACSISKPGIDLGRGIVYELLEFVRFVAVVVELDTVRECC